MPLPCIIDLPRRPHALQVLPYTERFDTVR